VTAHACVRASSAAAALALPAMHCLAACRAGYLAVCGPLPHSRPQQHPHAHSPHSPTPSPPPLTQTTLFGYEFPDTIAVLAGDTLYVHASAKKLSYLEPSAAASASQKTKLVLLNRDKGDNSVPANRAAIDRILEAVRSSGGKLGAFPTDAMEGPVAQGWAAEVAKAGLGVGGPATADGSGGVDATKGIEGFLAVKDEAALADVRKAGALAARSLKYVVVPDLETVIDEEKKVSADAFAAGLAATFESRAALEGRKVPVDSDNFEAMLGPLVQSGGDYDINVVRPGAVGASPAKPLAYDVLLVTLGMRYKTMRAVCSRTILIDPTPRMQKLYDGMVATQQKLIDGLRVGLVIKDAVTAARDHLLDPSVAMPLSAKLVRTFGGGIGSRVAEKHLNLTTKNATTIEAGMVFTVSMGLQDIPMEDKHAVADAAVNKLSTYSILLTDTVVVTRDGPVVVTDKAPKDRKQISYEMAGVEEEEEDEEEDEEEAEAKGGKKDKKDRSGGRRGLGAGVDANAGRDATGRSARLREKAKEVDPDAAKKREEHQIELLRRKQEDVAKGGRKGGADGDGDDEIENAPDILGYRATSDYPKGTRPNQIIVDKSRDCILVPMLGGLVPFHISTIKNVNKTEEGHKAFLRLNFYAPGQALGKDASPSMQAAVARHPDSVFVRTLNFMSRDHRNFVDVDQKIKAMLKQHRTQRKEEKETAGLVEQARLLLRKDGVVPKMVDINMWPSMSGRATQGTLSAHVNGLLFSSNKGERLEIIYGNIKTAVFQPCESEHVVLLHFHLKNPIMIGKKKYREVQFFTEVIEKVVALDGRGRSDYDPDELNEEERERQLRMKLNKAFKTFVQKVEDSAALDAAANFRAFEVPPRDLSFQGSWAKEMTTVLLGSSAIVAVVDKPPLVVPVDDIEFVHFERVTHGGKSFDMVIVLRAGAADKGTDEFVRISSIEMKNLETIKTWLDEVAEVIYTESVEALQWKLIIAEQVRDPHFWLEADEDGNTKNIGMGEILQPYGEGEGGEDGEEVEESEEYSESESEDESEEDSDEDFDDLVSEDDDESDYDEDEDDSEAGEDWDELERKAEAADKKRARGEGSDDDDDRGKKGDAKKRRK
jgi:nucleosome binding factor SPN SPT16 subunit